MSTLTIDFPQELYKRLEEQARKEGQEPEVFSRALIEFALQAREAPRSRTAREVLQAAGRGHALSDTLRGKIIPGVTLDEVRHTLSQAAGPSLSDIIREQRGA